MTTPAHFRRTAWLRTNFSLAVLLALLQRSPAIRLAQATVEAVSAPVAAVLKSAIAALGSLGVLHTLAGATALVPSRPSPVTVKQGEPVAPIAFTVSDTINLGSWRIGGSIPPGMKIGAVQGGADELTGPGILDATTEDTEGDIYEPGTIGNTMTLPVLSGTPTEPGTYTISFQAYQLGGLTGYNTVPFEYTVIVEAAASSGGGAGEGSGDGSGGGSGDGSGNTPGPTTAPAIARHPQPQTVRTGSTVVFNAEATGGSLSYEWRKNGSPIPGATRPALVLKAAVGDVGDYSVMISNSMGSVTSSPAALTLSDDPNFGHLVNLSIRTTITASDPTFTVGAVVGGAGTSGPKPMLVRAVGPTLAAFGLEGALTDSRVEVYAGSTVVATNNDWNGDAQLSSAFSQVGAFPLASATSKDAAIYNGGFLARDYTVEVGGVGGATGEVLAELYDATPTSAFTPTTPRLVNVSVRKQIDAGSSLTVGFVIGGNTARTVLVRAIGPGLAAFGLDGTMPDPQLALFNSSQVKIIENDNWGGDPQITSAGTSVGAFAIADAGSKDAMIFTTLPAGGYTVQVSGVPGTGGGSTLIEVYEVP